MVGPALAVLCVAWAGGCANQGAPPGGPVDRRPPVLLRTEPDTFATLTDLNAIVRFHFDERISETVSGGSLDDAVTVSPQTGAVRVSHGRTTLSVEIEGGFRPGLVYRVTVQPVVRDLFGNQLRDPFDLVFSTGGVPSPTAVAGQVWSRTTGQGVSRALVHALSADSLVHVARADEVGIYAFRYLPEGSYRVTAFDDLDRDGELDAREAQGSVAAPLSAGDTLLLDVPMLPSDTTAAVALTASALDSLTIVLEFDDFLDVDSSAAVIVVQLTREEGDAPTVTRLFHEREYATYVDQIVDSLTRIDSLETVARAAAAPPPPDTSVAAVPPDSATTLPPPASGGALPQTDSSAASPSPGGSGGAGAAALPPSAASLGRPGPPRLDAAQGGGRGGRGGGAAVARPLPTRRIVGLLDAPLATDIEHLVRVSGVVNINGIGGGGGDEITLLLRPPSPEGDGRGGGLGGRGASGGAPDPAAGAAGGPPGGAVPAPPDTTGGPR